MEADEGSDVRVAAASARTMNDRPSHMTGDRSLAAYCEDLRRWMVASRQWQYECAFQYRQLLLATYAASASTAEPRPSDHRPSSSSAATAAPVRFDSRGVGEEFVLPPLWKRVLAEVIDFSILLVIKALTSFLMINLFGMSALQVFDFDYAFINGELDLDKLVSMSAEIFIVEMIHRFLVSIYEGFCLAYASESPYGGSTPGKRLVGTAVISCSEVLTIGNNRVIVTPGVTPSLPAALVRSLVKNFAITFFLPTCLTVLVFEHGRAAYDVLAGTIVVEAKSRRRL